MVGMDPKEDKRCLACGKTLPPGRTDKRYCDDLCRARATRKRNKEQSEFGYEDKHKTILQAIKRNYSLLKKAMGDREEWIVDFEPLYRKGFNRLLYTSSEGKRFYCFELGWEDVGEGRLRVTVEPKQLNIFDSTTGTAEFGFTD